MSNKLPFIPGLRFNEHEKLLSDHHHKDQIFGFHNDTVMVKDTQVMEDTSTNTTNNTRVEEIIASYYKKETKEETKKVIPRFVLRYFGYYSEK